MSTETAGPIPLSPAQREACKALLRVIVKTSIAATKALESHVVTQDRPARMNMICAEFLHFHMWRACKRARAIMGAQAYQGFRDYAVHGLAVVAAGCFTGLYDKAAQRQFLQSMQGAFTVYSRCGPELISPSADVTTSNDQLPTVARAVADLAGRGGDETVIMQIILQGMEGYNATRVDDAVNDVVRA